MHAPMVRWHAQTINRQSPPVYTLIDRRFVEHFARWRFTPVDLSVLARLHAAASGSSPGDLNGLRGQIPHVTKAVSG